MNRGGEFSFPLAGEIWVPVDTIAGTTNATFDVAGNMLTRVDGRGKTSTYTHDALNRVASATFQDGSAVGFTYDQGANGKGRLTTRTWPGGQTGYTYNASSKVLTKTDTHTGGPTLAVAYGWDATTGRLTTLTYPSGKVLNFTYDTAGRASRKSWKVHA